MIAFKKLWKDDLILELLGRLTWEKTTFCMTTILVTLFSISVMAQNAYTEKEVSFKNGEVELKGTLLLPNVNTPSPVIIFIHGSGPHKREGFKPYAEEFSKLGFASLYFDKRGSGASGGSWTTSSISDLANDVLAAIEFLKEQDKIDPKKIGLWGISQAGWVAPLAASRSVDVAFMTLISGGGASPKESEYFSYRKMFEQAGLSEDSKVRAFKIVDAYFDYLSTGNGYTQLDETLKKLVSDTNDPLHQLPEIIRVPSEKNRPNWNWVATYDPVPDIEKFNKPVLILMGDQDTEHPVDLAVKKWTESLKKAGNKDATIMVFPKAGHGIRKGIGHNRNAAFADGYMEVQLGWLWKHVLEQKN